MNCSNYRQQASLYIDRQLDPAANQEFFFHLNSCSGCFEYVDELRRTAELLGQVPQLLPPKELASDIVAMVGQNGEARARNFITWLRNFTIYSRPQYTA